MSDNFIDIDLGRLEEEWAEQPHLYKRWAERLADAKKELAEGEDQLELIDAIIADQVRSDPGEFDIPRDKVTIPAVKSAVVRDPRHRKAKKKVIELQHRHDVLQAAVKSLDHRKKALEDIVFLWGKDYFSTPRLPKGVGGEKMAEAGKRAARSKTKYTR